MSDNPCDTIHPWHPYNAIKSVALSEVAPPRDDGTIPADISVEFADGAHLDVAALLVRRADGWLVIAGATEWMQNEDSPVNLWLTRHNSTPLALATAIDAQRWGVFE